MFARPGSTLPKPHQIKPSQTVQYAIGVGHTADRVCENCLCQGGTEKWQTKYSDMARKIAYHQRIPGEGKLVVGVACVACIVSHLFDILHHAGIL